MLCSSVFEATRIISLMTKSFFFLPLCVSILVALGCTKEVKRGAKPSVTGKQVKRTGRDKETVCESGTAGGVE